MCIHNVYVGKGDSVCDNGETAETEGRDDYSSPEVSEVILAVYMCNKRVSHMLTPSRDVQERLIRRTLF